jgi:type II secretory pathway pseudopilin PulG
MIVIAIIGVLAAALFPSVTWYILRWRDTARISALRDIGGSLMNYYNDKNIFPSGPVDCNLTTALTSYLWKIPTDPVNSRNNGCGNNGNFWYGTWIVWPIFHYVVSADLENPLGWYWNASWGTNPFTGTLSPTGINDLKFNLQKSAGPLYVNFQ